MALAITVDFDFARYAFHDVRSANATRSIENDPDFPHPFYKIFVLHSLFAVFRSIYSDFHHGCDWTISTEAECPD
jgi:hypothetical protein